MDRITSKIESILFVAGEPVLLSELCRGLELTEGELKQKLFELQLSYEAEDRGLRLFTTADTGSSPRRTPPSLPPRRRTPTPWRRC